MRIRRKIIRKIEDDELELILAITLKNQYCYYIYLKDSGEQIGYCDLRTGHTRDLYYYGNIGYRINEPYRGHGYAYKASTLLLQIAQAYDMKYVILTCSPENIASRKTIEKLGFKYIKTTQVPIWHPLYANERTKMIYQLIL